MSDFLVEGMGEKLKQARKALGLTQKQIAERLGVKQSYYSLIEAGKAGIPLSKGPVLFSDLGISEKWFFRDDVSDKYMFDSSGNTNTWEYQMKQQRESFKEIESIKEISFLKNLIKEKDSRIEDLSNLVSTKDQLIKFLYEKIESFKDEKKQQE